ncbi:MAG: YihY/virulence factor BrkB family protein [Bacteroidota bacterium]|jgi:membrane protein|nr:YihY/virulence factor BrkB family protein [Bacteroidota bacterium]MCA4900624.1 YihY/virulence factor BrkB family protein [Cytophagales bacterium]
MKYVTRKRILQFNTARTSRSWLKRIKFKKFDNLSLYKFIKIFLYNISEDEIMDRANGVSFNFILAIFPTIIFLFTLIPYVSIYFPEVTTETIMDFIKSVVPSNMYETIASTVYDIISKQRGGLLTFGVLFALYLSTNGMMALMRAFNACYRTVERRHWLRMRLTALGLTIMLAVVMLAAVVLLIVGQIALNYVLSHLEDFSHLNLDSFTIYLLFALRFLVIFIVFFLAISFIYYFGPAVHYNWSFFSIGSFLATLAILGLSYGFSVYITNFGSYNKVYGSIGALIALMAWIQLVTVILLYGYEVNASLHYGRKMEAVSNFQRSQRMEKAMR